MATLIDWHRALPTAAQLKRLAAKNREAIQKVNRLYGKAFPARTR